MRWNEADLATRGYSSKGKRTVMAKSTPKSCAVTSAPTGKRKNKYNNKRQMYKGLRFDSKMELTRWLQLEQLLAVGAIRDLRHHTRFPLTVNNIKIATYECDAEYWMEADGMHIVEDTKGVATPAFKIKKNLMKAIYSIDVQEIKIRG